MREQAGVLVRHSGSSESGQQSQHLCALLPRHYLFDAYSQVPAAVVLYGSPKADPEHLVPESAKRWLHHLGLFFHGESPDELDSCRWPLLLSQRRPFCRSSPTAGNCWHLRRNDHGKFAVGTGPRVYNELIFRSERFTRLKKYNANILGRDVFKNSFDSVRVLVF